MKKKMIIRVARPKINPVNLRYLCYRTTVFPDEMITKSGIIINTAAIIDKDAKLDALNRQSFIVVAKAQDNTAETMGENGVMRKVQIGDIVVPINQVAWEMQNDGTHERNTNLLVYPYWRQGGTSFYFIDQFEALAIIPDLIEIQFIDEDRNEEDIPDEAFVSENDGKHVPLHGTGPKDYDSVPFPAEV